jgi:hypothetical protein
MRGTRRWRAMALMVAALSAGGCASGALGDVLGGVLNPQGSGGERLLQGDVVLVDANRQYLQVRMTNGQTANVRFDSRTQVVYGQQAYPVTALERGDEISLRLLQTQQGEPYTDQIVVTRSIQEATGVNQGTTSGSRQYMRVEGTVGQIDTRQGVFQIRSQNGGYLWVSLPYNTSSTTVSQFQRLRAGDYVRVGGYMIANDRLELQSFL